MALAIRGVYDDPVYGITRPFVAFQGSSWVGHPGFAIIPTMVKVLDERVETSGKLCGIPSCAVRCLSPS